MTVLWPRAKLADCVDLLAGFPFKSQHFSDKSDDLPLVKGENVAHGCIEWAISKRWPVHDWGRLQKFQLHPGDVVVAMDRPWIPAGLKWAFIREGDPKALLVQRVARLRTSNGKLDQDFLRFIIGSPEFENYVRPITTGVGVPHISGRQILDFEFMLPPLSVQRRVTAILSAYDQQIESNQRRMRILEEMTCALHREWFVKFQFPGHEKENLGLPTRRAIPKSWVLKPMADCVDVNPRVPIPREGEKPFVPMTSLANNSMLITDLRARSGNSGSKFQNGDTLFARITPCLENGKTSFVQFLPNPKAVAFGSTEFIVLRSRSLTPEFVYCLARSEEVRGVAIKSMTGATGRQRVQEKCFDTISVAHPPRDWLDRFSSIAAPSFRMIQKLHLQIQNLRRTRDLLLPRLLSGAS